MNLYKDYLASLSPSAASRVLLLFVVGMVAVETAARLINPLYQRTAVSSLHGIRAILQQALEGNDAKILCLGDSSLVGGGIYRHDQTVIGYLASEIEGPRIYNLAVPGGNSESSLLLLDQLNERKVAHVDRVIIETMAAKWIASSPAERSGIPRAGDTSKELRHFIPDIDFPKWNIAAKPVPFRERLEVAVQWQLGWYSMLYRHRDYFRTEMTGNYPAFWLVGQLPRSVMSRLTPEKARGTNRLAARMNDFNFEPAQAQPGAGLEVRFFEDGERKYLLDAISLAKNISGKPPTILAFPMHYEFRVLGLAEKESYLHAIEQFEVTLKKISEDTGSELLMVRSEEFQDPANWTATPFHFNAVGAAKIWEKIRPYFRQRYGYREASSGPSKVK